MKYEGLFVPLSPTIHRFPSGARMPYPAASEAPRSRKISLKRTHLCRSRLCSLCITFLSSRIMPHSPSLPLSILLKKRTINCTVTAARPYTGLGSLPALLAAECAPPCPIPQCQGIEGSETPPKKFAVIFPQIFQQKTWKMIRTAAYFVFIIEALSLDPVIMHMSDIRIQ